MDDTAYFDSYGKKYSVDLSFERNPFITYPVACFNDVNVAYKWLSDLHNLILREHLLQITDSHGDVVFNLSHFWDFDVDLKEGSFVTSEHWFWIPEDYVQADLPF